MGNADWISQRGVLWLLFGIGLAWRLWLSHAIFLNPDEAMHYLLSLQPCLAATYRETLGTAHPPLYIVFLHYWGYLGSSEFFLRLPCVIASMGFYGIIFLWVKKVATLRAASITLILLLFSPSLIYLSTEVRQYSFLLFFCASALYFLECAFSKQSVFILLGSGFALWLALLTHYAAILFALTLGLYGLIRIWELRNQVRFIAAWVGMELVALAILGFLYKTHIARQISSGQAESIADTYLRGSIFHPAQDHVVSFIFKTTIRLFHYFFSQEMVGIIGLLLFVYAIVFLWRSKSISSKPSSRQLAFLLAFPLLANCALALRGIYPYGGTRHNSYLAIFIFPAIAFVLAGWMRFKRWLSIAAIVILLTICNLFPAPTGPYISRKNQSREKMQSAVNFLHEAPPGSIIFTDYQGGLLLSYYLCNHKVVLLDPPYEDLHSTFCGQAQVVSLDPRKWIFGPKTFPNQLYALQRTYNPMYLHTVWVFQAGWVVDQESDLRSEFDRFGCPVPHDFGRNILACQLSEPSGQR